MQLEKIRAVNSIGGLAQLLGFKLSALNYLLYKLPTESKYSSFSIPKRSGGMRIISAPDDRLKNLQRRLAKLLTDCLKEIEESSGVDSPSHGFKAHRSIITNASVHRGRRFVLNVDLESFFPSIHFGRVKGYFENSNDFKLQPAVAMLIAKIACHEKSLPQGAPTSPVISNLIGRILDLHLCRLAKKHKITYSRYADDLTFSTNLKEFPSAVAENGGVHSWTAGIELVNVIRQSGFKINHAKTRVQYRTSRQDVTGLVVNQRVAVKSEYRHWARAAVHRLVNKDNYFEPSPKSFVGPLPATPKPGSLRKLHGVLSFIYSTHAYRRKNLTENGGHKDIKNEFHSDERLFQTFLYYTQFYRSEKPLIVCEGKTDNVYIRAALGFMKAKYPSLISETEEKNKLLVRFYPHPRHGGHLLAMGGGTGGIKNFGITYVEQAKKFAHVEPRNPIVVVLDADKAGQDVIKWATHQAKTHGKNEGGFLFLKPNLYFIVIPEIKGATHQAIESLFPKTLTNTELNGKKFSWKNIGFDNKTEYSKTYFAKHVIPSAVEADFLEFQALLEKIEAAVLDFKKAS